MFSYRGDILVSLLDGLLGGDQLVTLLSKQKFNLFLATPPALPPVVFIVDLKENSDNMKLLNFL